MKNILIAGMILILLFGCADSPPPQENTTKQTPPSPASEYKPATVERKTPAVPEVVVPAENKTEPPEPVIKIPALPDSTLTPCRGAQPPDPRHDISGVPLKIPDGPWYRRMMIAESEDGLNWMHLDKILFDVAETSGAMIDKDGRIYVYTTHFCREREWNGNLSLAASDDNGETWHYYKPEIITLKAQISPGNPEPVSLADGKIRLYLTSPDLIKDYRPQCNEENGGNVIHCNKTFSAVSVDGIKYYKENGVRFEQQGNHIITSSALYAEGKYWLFAWNKEKKENQIVSSSDGLIFTANLAACPRIDNGCLRITSVIADQDGYRAYGYDLNPLGKPNAIYSAFSKDLRDWKVEEGLRLTVETDDNLESEFVYEPAVVKLADRYLMFYATKIPEKDNANSLYYATYADVQPGYENLYCDNLCDEYERTHPESACHDDCRQ